MSSVYPAIPDPTPTVESLAETVRVMKVAVELLTGQREGASPNKTFVQTGTPTAINAGDRWVDGDGTERYWDGASWMKPSAANVQALLDSVNATQGALLYRDASAWAALSPGVAGQLLQTGGAGANPSWVASATRIAFGAYHNTTQAISSGSWYQIAFNTEEFDTNNNFALNAFTPTVAGYYQLNANVYWSGGLSETRIAVYKNGSVFKLGANAYYGYTVGVSTIVYANGTTDTFTIYGYTASSQSVSAGPQNAYFNGALVATA